MKKIRVFGIIILSAAMMSFTADRVIRKQNDGTAVVNTTTLAREIGRASCRERV